MDDKDNQTSARFTVNPVILAADLKDAAAMFWAAVRGKYKVPVTSLFWAGLFGVYFLLPFDAVPEAVFLFLGFSDDLLLLLYILNKMRPDIDEYRAFRNNQKNGGEVK